MQSIKNKFSPLASESVPRYAGIATFMRLPHMDIQDSEGAQIGFMACLGMAVLPIALVLGTGLEICVMHQP